MPNRECIAQASAQACAAMNLTHNVFAFAADLTRGPLAIMLRSLHANSVRRSCVTCAVRLASAEAITHRVRRSDNKQCRRLTPQSYR
jgi:hypothetical protein